VSPAPALPRSPRGERGEASGELARLVAISVFKPWFTASKSSCKIAFDDWIPVPRHDCCWRRIDNHPSPGDFLLLRVSTLGSERRRLDIGQARSPLTYPQFLGLALFTVQ